VRHGRYVLVTAARNEEAYIEKTLESVVSQFVRPVRWVIVSDGSTDRTDEIVARFAAEWDFIELLRRVANVERDFGGKVLAIQVAMEHLKDVDYDYVGIVDADVSFGPDYYKNAIEKLQRDPRLGIVGGVRFDNYGGTFHRVLVSPNSAGGPTQFFHRQCYEAIGGYLPLREGGVDAAAEATARMKGWKVRTFEDIELWHHRLTGTQNQQMLFARYRQGRVDYSVGNHPLFEVVKCIYRMSERPFVLSSLFRFCGFCRAALNHEKRIVPGEVVDFLRKEQLQRLNPFRKWRRQAKTQD